MREDLDDLIAGFLRDAIEFLLFAPYLVGGKEAFGRKGGGVVGSVAGCGRLVVVVQEALTVGLVF
jgi:hypothetical protein